MSQALIALINLSAVYAFPRGAWERVRKFPSAEGCQAKPDGVVDENPLCVPTQSMGTSTNTGVPTRSITAIKLRKIHLKTMLENPFKNNVFLVPTLPRGNLLCSLPHGNTSLKF